MDDTTRRHVFRTTQLEEADGPGLNPTQNRTMGEIIAARFSRRGFLRGSMAPVAISATVSPMARRRLRVPPAAPSTSPR